MKLTLLLLWSLGSVPLHDTCSTCQPNGMVNGGQAYPATSYGGPGIGNGQVSQFNEFSSPCGDCNGGNGGCYGDGLGRCNGRGRCRACCKDSTCNMYQHYPYEPDNHGYYYFAPYNYTMVWKHQQWITTIGGDPRNPYTRAMFIPVYEQFENTVYEPDHKPSQTLNTLPVISKQLPDLESLLRKPEGEAPTPVPPIDAAPEAPAPKPAAANTDGTNILEADPAAAEQPVVVPELQN